MRTLASVLLFASLAVAQVSPGGPHVSPFRGMRAVDAGIEVQVADDTWHSLESVAGVDTATLLREAKRLCDKDAWKRITEDLPALLDAMGTKVGEAVDLEVKDLSTGEIKKLPAVKMTGENRRRVKAANDGRPLPEAPATKTAIAAADARADLRTLQLLLDESFAYRRLRSVDLDALLRAADAEIGEQPVPYERMLRLVDRVLRAFGDGHSRVEGVEALGSVFLPFLVQQVEGGAAAFLPDRKALLDPARPIVEAIDGVPIAKWLAAARARATQGSETMQARGAERGLRELGELREELKVPATERVLVTLRGPAGTRDLALATSDKRPVYGDWPRTQTRVLDGNVGYLRLPQMRGDPEFLDGLDEAMQGFKDTNGLVIDVRGNGGGTRDALRRLAPYFLPVNGAPVVGNVAAALVDRARPRAPEALADRGLWQADWEEWSDAQRAAITAFARGFKPSWSLPAGQFSPWHFLVMDRTDNAKAYAYGKKVVVLIDRGCFSATDVFAAALRALPNVALVGEATSGGSGRARSHVLPKSGVRLQLSTMASFRPDGVLFEGNGVVPDVAVALQPGDLVGTTDSALAKARELLR